MLKTSLYVHPGLEALLQAGRSLVMVKSPEEDRLAGLLKALANHHQRLFMTWQVNLGLHDGSTSIPDTQAPERALAHLTTLDTPCLVWFKDLHHHFTPLVVRGLRDFYYHGRNQGSTLVYSATIRAVPEDLERETAVLDLDLPSSSEIRDHVTRWLNDNQQSLPIELGVVAATLRGLTLSECWHALQRVLHSQIDEHQLLRTLQEEKRQLIQRSGTVEYIHRVPNMEHLGGLDNLKDWLSKRKSLLLSDDPATREITPKGLLLMGVSGCGKSLCVKAISSIWQLPLYRLEMVRIFSGANGNPEAAFADACRLMEEMAPAILWIDEIEMGLSGDGSAAADPVLSRIFAFFLTWMQEKPPGLFVAATANRIDLLPAEMIRKGRFDQVFFVDLPTVAERRDIFRIHLNQRGYDAEQFNLDVFADGTEGWNGAEIEQCVIAAITQATMEDRDLELRDLYASRKQIVPISTTMEEQVRHIRNWAYDRAVRATSE